MPVKNVPKLLNFTVNSRQLPGQPAGIAQSEKRVDRHPRNSKLSVKAENKCPNDLPQRAFITPVNHRRNQTPERIYRDDQTYFVSRRKLGITQSTLSNEIKKLEASLGFKLFDRSDKWDIALTASGKSYLQHVKDIPAMLDFARQNALEIARGGYGSAQYCGH